MRRVLPVVVCMTLLPVACTEAPRRASRTAAPASVETPAPLADAGPSPARLTRSPLALRWRPGRAVPTPRTEVAAASLAGKVWVAGGFAADGSASDAVEVYDPARDAWEPGPQLPHGLHHAVLVATSDRLFLIGGYIPDGAPTDEVWTLVPAEREWRPGPAMPVRAGALAGALAGGRIHVAGGATGLGSGSTLSDGHFALDPAAGRWERLVPLPEARDHLTAAAVGNTFVVAGGRKLSLESNTSRVDVFDTTAGSWTRAPDMPTPRGGLGAAVWDGKVFVAGGEEPGGTIAAVESYDPDSRTWARVPDLPTKRHGVGVAALGDGIVVVAGGPTPGLSVSGATELLRAA